MRKCLYVLAAVFASQPCIAADFATPAEAEAMVKRAIAHMQKAGREQAYADITGRKAGLVDRDLYVTVITLNGVNVAHGQNPKMVGMNLLEFKDVDGKLFYRERLDIVQAKGKLWQDYKFVDPVTKKVLPKSMYCERDNDVAVCAGVYKR